MTLPIDELFRRAVIKAVSSQVANGNPEWGRGRFVDRVISNISIPVLEGTEGDSTLISPDDVWMRLLYDHQAPEIITRLRKIRVAFRDQLFADIKVELPDPVPRSLMEEQ